MRTLRHEQTSARNSVVCGRLLGSTPSPYMTDLNGIGTKQEYKLFLTTMDALIVGVYIISGVPNIAVSFYDTSAHTYSSTQILPMSEADIAANGYEATVEATINAYAAGNSFSVTKFMGGIPAGLKNAPQAAIADSTTNLTTNYNLVSGVLGLATGLNSANTAQNDMATKLNTLLSELRTLGLTS